MYSIIYNYNYWQFPNGVIGRSTLPYKTIENIGHLISLLAQPAQLSAPQMIVHFGTCLECNYNTQIEEARVNENFTEHKRI